VGARVTRARRALLAVLGAQAGVLLAVVGYLAGGGPLHPGGGLRQLDLLSLDEPVPGVAATGRPQLLVAAGDQSAPTCREQVARALAHRGQRGGTALRYDLVLLLPGPTAGAPGTTADPDGALARRLALPAAATSCAPGYAIADGRGHVRYRTYDAGWAAHSSEQDVLLGALR